MKPAEGEVHALSSRLRHNLLALTGKAAEPVPRFQWQLLIPVAVIVGAVVLVSLSPKARKSTLIEVALFASTRLLQKNIDA